MFQKLSRLLYRAMRHVLRLGVMAAVMMAVGWLLQDELTAPTYSYLTRVQGEALAAVRGINPLQIKDRFVCAMRPSIESMNRMSAGLAYHPPLASDCMYTLSNMPRTSGHDSHSDSTASSAAALPPPVVRHWADNSSPMVSAVIAFLDTGWHLVVQRSVFATVFALFAFVLGALIAGMLMMLPRFTWHPYLGGVVFCVGAVAFACLVAWGMQMLMEGGLYLFGRVTQIAGLCCGGAGMSYLGYSFFMKTIEVRVHEGIEQVMPH